LTIVVRDVVKRYERGGEAVEVLKAVSLELASGTMTALVGPSGCGKSTLLNLIGCVDLPSSGQVFIDGVDTAQLNDDALTALRREKVGTVFQSFFLIEALTLAENVAIPFLLAGKRRAEARALSEELLARVQLTDHADMLPSQASARSCGNISNASVCARARPCSRSCSESGWCSRSISPTRRR
jgi:ABC-type lipoprotein export system ATPase subunit